MLKYLAVSLKMRNFALAFGGDTEAMCFVSNI